MSKVVVFDQDVERIRIRHGAPAALLEKTVGNRTAPCVVEDDRAVNVERQICARNAAVVDQRVDAPFVSVRPAR